VVHRSEDATARLGMPGLVVGVQELIDDAWWLSVEATADRAACATCGTRAVGLSTPGGGAGFADRGASGGEIVG
jgi:hypothetical protein